MNISPPVGGDTHLEMAVKIINQIVQQKVGLGACRLPLNNAVPLSLLLFHVADVRRRKGLCRSCAVRDRR